MWFQQQQINNDDVEKKKLKILISYFLLVQKFACITKNALNIILCKSNMLFHNFLTTNHLYEFLMELNFDCFKQFDNSLG